jgi:hypothetical protein
LSKPRKWGCDGTLLPQRQKRLNSLFDIFSFIDFAFLIHQYKPHVIQLLQPWVEKASIAKQAMLAANAGADSNGADDADLDGDIDFGSDDEGEENEEEEEEGEEEEGDAGEDDGAEEDDFKEDDEE